MVYTCLVYFSVRICLKRTWGLIFMILSLAGGSRTWCILVLCYLEIYSLNVKRVKWLLFNRVKSVRNTLTEWKITLKTSENHSEESENHSKKSENHSNRVNSTLRGSAQRDSLKQKSCPSVSFPKKWNSLYWSDFHSFWSDFHSLWNDFHSF